MAYWYYDKKELRQTPSFLQGLATDTEMTYRREGARFILQLGNKMGLKYETMATGVVYFHRFYMIHSFQEFPRHVTACCSLFLAGKVEETPKKCKDIMRHARALVNDETWAEFGPDPREEVMTLERILLQTIKFDFIVDHPYTYLLKYAKCLKGDKKKLQSMVQMAWTFVNDGWSCTTLSLQWEPEIIAIALVYLAGKLSKFEVVDWQGRTPKHQKWWDMFVSGISMELLEDICHQVLDLYSPNKAADGLGRGPQNSASLVDGKVNISKDQTKAAAVAQKKENLPATKSASDGSKINVLGSASKRIKSEDIKSEAKAESAAPTQFSYPYTYPTNYPPNYNQGTPSNASLPNYNQTAPNNADLSNYNQAAPSGASLSNYNQTTPSSASLSNYNQVAPSSASLSNYNQAAPSNASLSSTPPASKYSYNTYPISQTPTQPTIPVSTSDTSRPPPLLIPPNSAQIHSRHPPPSNFTPVQQNQYHPNPGPGLLNTPSSHRKPLATPFQTAPRNSTTNNQYSSSQQHPSSRSHYRSSTPNASHYNTSNHAPHRNNSYPRGRNSRGHYQPRNNYHQRSQRPNPWGGNDSYNHSSGRQYY